MHHTAKIRTVGLIASAIIALLMFVAPARAAKTCYDCHKAKQTEFNSKKTVHQPVKDQNCETCHKRHGFANNLQLVSITADLCYGCHKDLKDKFATGTAHFPVEKGRCWDCHDPHASDKAALLRKGPEGADDPSACLMCHKDDLTASLKAKFPHDPFSKLQCTTCHEAHNSTFDILLKSAPDSLCSSCHKLTEKKFLSAHVGKHSENLKCIDCHSGHSSDTKGLLSETTHPPFAQGDCTDCHSLPDAAGKVTFAEGVTPGGLCANCHADQAAGHTKTFPHEAVTKDNCTDCHSPHSSRYPHLLKQPEDKLCGQCHADIAVGEGLAPHAPAVVGDCGKCHDVHGSDRKSLVKQADAGLCLQCHTDFKAAKDSAKVVHAGAEDCLQCHAPHKGRAPNLLRNAPEQLCGDCHPVDPNALTAESSHPPYLTQDCVACHSPHYSNNDHLVRRTDTQLCVSCHSEVLSRTKMKTPHAPATEDCRSCHSPHFSKQPALLASPARELCSGCHDYATLNMNKEFVHTPAAAGDCTGCHNPHGASQDKLLSGRLQIVTVNGVKTVREPDMTGKYSDLCFSCHDKLQEKFRGPGVHAPVAQGKCDACHAPHGSDFYGFLKHTPSSLCSDCHAVDTTLISKHSGYDIKAANCLDCHNPHMSDKPKLIRTNSHPPFEEKSCETCHTVGPNGSVQLAGNLTEICSACHDMVKTESGKKTQHAPFASGECTSCHSIHAADYSHLLKFDGNDMCLSCHTDIKDLSKQSVQHQPFAKGKCLDCHAPHASDNPKLVLKPQETLCLNCHTELKDQIGKGVVHSPVKAGSCTACHLPHAGAQTSLLVATKQQLCARCHNLTAATFVAAHKNFPMAGADCQNCHVAHVSAKGVKSLLKPDTHKPFVSRDCNQCHQPTGNRDLISPVRDLCLKCHPDFQKSLEMAVVHPPASTPDGCVSCHGPHVAFGKALQKNEGVKTCLTCHNGPEFTSSLKHPPAFEDCGTCHQPHASQNKQLLENPNITELCTTCHEDAVKTHFHPMGDKATDPRTRQPLNCVGCHTPHSSEYAPLLIADKNRKLCVLCHDVSHSEK
jgi:predicted CXXCH cytochrome family protein